VDLPETARLYYADYKLAEFDAKVIYAKGSAVVLDKSAFYPTSGGQENDTGQIADEKVTDVIAQENRVLHLLQNSTKLKAGQKVKCKIDFPRRKQLTQHHDGTHVLNYACREILGKHCWQHGSYVGTEKARFDVTHYKPMEETEAKKIEHLCNRIIKKRLPIKQEFLARNVAEEKYGMRIYQGGYVPGKELRILSVAKLDIEACGGTHAKNTKDIEQFRILNTTKIQDGVIRINFACGAAAEKTGTETAGLLETVAKLLSVSKAEVPSACENIFRAWKKAKKAAKKKNLAALKQIEIAKPEAESGLNDEELMQKAAACFKTHPEHVPKTAERFLSDLKKWKGA
ncbi:alanine--tRNA ligase, partial [Candidatus Micrarchaeota archaeon]|nr:alanine--tRNA ligase [Candidatus Micrarchaeota archaeon]MBU1939613.1 alanine--tRNA ligase [Candidatus Micrarchaeota archaeon]